MKIRTIDGFDELHGAPDGWTPEENGECLYLPTRKIAANGIVYRVSLHEFTDKEREAIAAGARLYLWLSSPKHPVTSIAIEGVNYLDS